MPDAARKVAKAWLEATLQKRGERGSRYNVFDTVPPEHSRYNLFDPVPESDQRAVGRGIFDPPGGAPPEPPKPALGIFDSPGGPRAPAPPAPRAEPAAPQAPQAPPQAPAPQPAPQPPRAQPAAPGAGKVAPDALKGLKRDRKFQTFLREKHQGGRGKVPHPLPRLRRRYRDGIKFWTAMKYENFHGGVMREFEAWKQEQAGEDAGAGRAEPAEPAAAGRQVGQRIGEIGNLRVGDVVQRHDGGQKWRVTALQDDPNAWPIQMQRLDDQGEPVGRPLRHNPNHMLPNYQFVELAEERPKLERPSDEGWREKDAGLLRLAREGKPTGLDIPLGGDQAQNGAVKRLMKLPDGTEHEFVYKASSKEKPHLRLGTPDLGPREQAAYEIDALLGDGRVVPASAMVVPEGGGRLSGGAYQAFVPGAKNFIEDAEGHRTLRGIRTVDLIEHPQVQRMTVLDALLGHEDRHPGNVMFSWADPQGPKTAENLQIHAIDNGYCLAESDGKRGMFEEELFDIRDPWNATTDWRDPAAVKDRWQIQKKILSELPEQLHEQLKQVKPSDVAKAMVEAGVRDAGAIQSALVRLVAMQDNRGVLGSFIGRRRDDNPHEVPPVWARSAAQKGQADWHRQSHHNPGRLLHDHTDLDADEAIADIRRVVRQALEG